MIKCTNATILLSWLVMEVDASANDLIVKVKKKSNTTEDHKHEL